MIKNEAIDAAIAQIGEGKKDDYALSPIGHAEEFKQRAPILAEILRSGAISDTANDYQEKDQEAVDAQRKFKSLSNRANLLILFTSVLTALVLVIGIATIDNGWKRGLAISFGILGVIAGAWAARDIFVAKQGKFLEEWMKRRAEAETFRLLYFSSIVEAAPDNISSDDVPIDLLKLEYFRRFQLDIQLAFYLNRGRQHELEAARVLNYGAIAVFGAGVAVGVAGILSGVDLQYAALASLGTVFAALTAFATVKEGISQSRRNSERYARTHEILNKLKKRIGDVRNAVFDDGKEPLSAFVNAIHEQISLEHRQWLDEKSDYQKSIADLDLILAKNKGKK